MDGVDEKIISILKKYSRTPFVDIGRQVNLSEAAVRRRVQKLVKDQIIRRFTIEVDSNKGAQAISLISVDPSIPTSNVSERLMRIKGVQIVYEITGQYDIAAILSAPNIAEINICIDELRKVSGVATTNSIIILKTLR